MKKKRALLLTKYSSLAASSRYRAYQYLQFLEEEGFEVVISPLLPDTYLQDRFSANSKYEWALGQSMPVVKKMIERGWIMLREVPKFDVVYLQYEALPYLPDFLEAALFRRNRHIVVDYDDAINLNYDANTFLRPFLGGKIPEIVRRSSQVIVANRNLAEWAEQYNSNLTIIPTSVDLRRYPWPRVRPDRTGKPVIGWIGTPNTATFLHMLERPLRALRERSDFVLKVIGAPGFTMDGVEVVSLPWSEATEVRDLHSVDVGVMPIPDDDWGRGKSALKLVQYLAAGVPAIGSAVGANCDVLDRGTSGLLASSDAEWIESLTLLLQNQQRREQLVSAGRRRVEERFSVQANAPRFVQVLREASSQ